MSEANRRDFIAGTAWMGVAALAAGYARGATNIVGPGLMTDFAANPIKRVRIGHVGLGARGPGAVHRMTAIPGMEVSALCDLFPERAERQRKWVMARRKGSDPKIYSGEEGYKALCESDIDLVYVTTPWALHAPVALYAMEHGKHVVVEVPAAMNLDQCWALVETAERTGRHCMQLENCCYGEIEMLTLNMVRQGVLGELVHAEGGYIHDLRSYNYTPPEKGGYQGWWRLKWNTEHNGNQYPTHGLVPLMQSMNINRGDRFDFLTCVESAQFGMAEYAQLKYAPESWQVRKTPACGDMATTVIRSVKGRTIMIQHDVTSPRPYGRNLLLSGTRGIIADSPYRVALAEKPGNGVSGWFGDKCARDIREKYRHPLWKAAGDLAKKVGGHGGMDFLMDLRLAYCLQNGLPLDMDVYDLAASCSLCELTEKSARNRGRSQDIPDFTRGGWKTAQPLGIHSVDFSRLGMGDVQKDLSACDG